MGAHNHPTTHVETDDYTKRRLRLKRDLIDCESVTATRAGLFAECCVVVETDERGLGTDAVSVLAEHGARVGANKRPDDPFEVFLE